MRRSEERETKKRTHILKRPDRFGSIARDPQLAIVVQNVENVRRDPDCQNRISREKKREREEETMLLALLIASQFAYVLSHLRTRGNEMHTEELRSVRAPRWAKEEGRLRAKGREGNHIDHV